MDEANITVVWYAVSACSLQYFQGEFNAHATFIQLIYIHTMHNIYTHNAYVLLLRYIHMQMYHTYNTRHCIAVQIGSNVVVYGGETNLGSDVTMHVLADENSNTWRDLTANIQQVPKLCMHVYIYHYYFIL